MFKLSDYIDFSKINDVEYMKEKGLKSFKISALTLIKYNKEKLNQDNLNTIGIVQKRNY